MRTQSINKSNTARVWSRQSNGSTHYRSKASWAKSTELCIKTKSTTSIGCNGLASTSWVDYHSSINTLCWKIGVGHHLKIGTGSQCCGKTCWKIDPTQENCCIGLKRLIQDVLAINCVVVMLVNTVVDSYFTLKMHVMPQCLDWLGVSNSNSNNSKGPAVAYTVYTMIATLDRNNTASYTIQSSFGRCVIELSMSKHHGTNVSGI